MMRPTSGAGRRSPTLLYRVTVRNTAPPCTCASHACSARTGQVVGQEPYGRPIVAPSPSWSVFERRILTSTPSVPKVRSCTSSATSSLRRNAPANPVRSRARSRSPIGVRGSESHTRRRSSTISGFGATLCDAYDTADTAPCRPHDLRFGWIVGSSLTVCVPQRRESLGNRRWPKPLIRHGGDVVGNRLGRGGYGVGFAEALDLPRVGGKCAFRPGVGAVLLGHWWSLTLN